MAGPDFTQLVTIDVVSGDALQTKRSTVLKSLINQDGVFYTAAYVVGTQGLVAGDGYFVPGTGLSILANGDVFTHGGLLVNVPTGHPQKPLDVMVNGALKVRIDTDGSLSVLNSFYTGPGRITVIPQDTVNEGGEIAFNGAGSNRYFYIDNFQGNMRVITQDASGESEKFRISNAGNVEVAAGSLSVATKQKIHFEGPTGTRYAYINRDVGDTAEFTDGRIAFSYSLFIKKPSNDAFTDPPQMWIGKDRMNFLYIVHQETTNSSGKFQDGVVTVARQDPDV